MRARWCIPVLVRDDPSEEADLVRYCLAMTRVEHVPAPGGFDCLGEAGEDAQEARRQIRKELRAAGVEHAVVMPLRILYWDEQRSEYVGPDAPEKPDRRERIWCVSIPLRADATPHEYRLLGRLLELAGFDADVEDAELACYAPEDTNPKRLRERVTAHLRGTGFADAVVGPLRIFRWDEERSRYLDSTGVERPEPLHPADIHWKVVVTCADVFAFEQLLGAVGERKRTILDEEGWRLHLGARDEQDARGLAAELLQLPSVSAAIPEKPGHLARWRVRQRLLGNYGVDYGGP